MGEKSAHLGGREVTVQALRVDGKKMTLQLFRQVPKISYFLTDDVPDDSLSPWGLVLYKIPNEGETWLLAERDGQLVRCCVDLPYLSTYDIDSANRGIEQETERAALYDTFTMPGASNTAAKARERVGEYGEKLVAAIAAHTLRKRQREALEALHARMPQLFIA